MEPKTLKIGDVEYVRKDSITNFEPAEELEGLKYVIVRTYSAGVFAGYLKNKEGKEVNLINARRLWMWHGAASLSQLAIDGVSKPKECKFPCEVKNIVLTEAIEIIDCSEKARLSIKNVEIWKEEKKILIMALALEMALAMEMAMALEMAK